jgi:hypothetical protein
MNPPLFDEAFDIIVDYCASVAPDLAAASGHAASSARTNSYGNDVWIAAIVRGHFARLMDPNLITREHYLPFYDAAWELCRIGVLRPVRMPQWDKAKSGVASLAVMGIRSQRSGMTGWPIRIGGLLATRAECQKFSPRSRSNTGRAFCNEYMRQSAAIAPAIIWRHASWPGLRRNRFCLPSRLRRKRMSKSSQRL